MRFWAFSFFFCSFRFVFSFVFLFCIFQATNHDNHDYDFAHLVTTGCCADRVSFQFASYNMRVAITLATISLTFFLFSFRSSLDLFFCFCFTVALLLVLSSWTLRSLPVASLSLGRYDYVFLFLCFLGCICFFCLVGSLHFSLQRFFILYYLTPTIGHLPGGSSSILPLSFVSTAGSPHSSATYSLVAFGVEPSSASGNFSGFPEVVYPLS